MGAPRVHIPGEGVRAFLLKPIPSPGSRKRAIRPLPSGEVRKLQGHGVINIIGICGRNYNVAETIGSSR